MDLKTALFKLQRYCAYRERCRSELMAKMKDWKLSKADKESIVEILEDERFLDEKRFAELFVSGKFRLKKWGKNKIRQQLKSKKIPQEFITYALTLIDDEAYRQTLESLFEKKQATLRETDPVKRKTKLVRYLIQKGYEPGLVWEMVNGKK